MPYYPHVVKNTAGIQPGVVDEVYYSYDAAAAVGQQVRLYVDVSLMANPSTRNKLRYVRYVGRLVADSANQGSYPGASATASGGFYDTLRSFYLSVPGGSQSEAQAEALIRALVKGRAVTVQTLGGRLVVV